VLPAPKRSALRKPSGGLVSGPFTLARRLSEEPDQDPQRPDGDGDEDEQVNDRDAQVAIPNVALPFVS
jgi:hypothetical protein